jgi:hypothetical protein
MSSKENKGELTPTHACPICSFAIGLNSMERGDTTIEHIQLSDPRVALKTGIGIATASIGDLSQNEEVTSKTR